MGGEGRLLEQVAFLLHRMVDTGEAIDASSGEKERGELITLIDPSNLQNSEAPPPYPIELSTPLLSYFDDGNRVVGVWLFLFANVTLRSN